MALYFVKIEGKSFGPLPLDGIEGMLSSGRVSMASEVCEEGQSQWTQFRSLYLQLEYECLVGPETTGPFTLEHIRQALNEKLLSEDDGIRRAGSSRWHHLKTFLQLIDEPHEEVAHATEVHVPPPPPPPPPHSHPQGHTMSPPSHHGHAVPQPPPHAPSGAPPTHRPTHPSEEPTKTAVTPSTHSVPPVAHTIPKRETSFTPSEIRRARKSDIFMSEKKKTQWDMKVDEVTQTLKTWIKTQVKNPKSKGDLMKSLPRFEGKPPKWVWAIVGIIVIFVIILILPKWESSEPTFSVKVPTKNSTNPSATAPTPTTPPSPSAQTAQTPQGPQTPQAAPPTTSPPPQSQSPSSSPGIETKSDESSPTTPLVTPPKEVAPSTAVTPNLPDEEVATTNADRLKLRFNAVLWIFSQTFEEHIKTKYKNVVDRVTLPPRWIPKGQNKYMVEAQFRGTLQLKTRSVPNVFFQYGYFPEGWVLLDTNYSDKVQKASKKRKQQWSAYGSESDWDALFAILERKAKDKIPQKSDFRAVTKYLEHKDLLILMDRLQKGDFSGAGLLASQLRNPKLTQRGSMLKLLKGANSLEVIFHLKDFAKDSKTPEKLSSAAIQLLGGIKSPESFAALKDILMTSPENLARVAAPYVAAQADADVVQTYVGWIKRATGESGLVFAQSLGDAASQTSKPHLEKVFWEMHERKRSDDTSDVQLALARGLFRVDPPSATTIFVRAFPTAHEREKLYYSERFKDQKSPEALGVVRDQLRSQNFTKLEDYVSVQVNCIDLVESLGDQSDIPLLDEVLQKAKGTYAAPIREAATRVRGVLVSKFGEPKSNDQ